MRLDELTWKEVGEYLRSNRQMIVPIGTCEQHGPHLPLNTDTLVVDKLAEYLSEEAGMLVGPTLNYGVNLPCDRGYAGTCSTTKELLKGFFGSLLKWWKEQGFRRFFVLSAHGDPHHIEALEASDPETVVVLELYDFDMTGVLEKQHGAKHACEAETSVMMYLFREKVRSAEIQDFETPFEDFKPYLIHEKIEAIEGAPGNQGYPSWADAEKGKILFSRMKKHALEWLLRNTEKERSKK
ncbi:MAG: creatininase family protein [Candidatus Riflebacteria bacterium]|nr:creatininase family protein [Candidatus Riflebacteria bacterium]